MKNAYLYHGLLWLLLLVMCISVVETGHVRILSTPTNDRTRVLGLSMVLTIPLILLIFVIEEYACQRIKLATIWTEKLESRKQRRGKSYLLVSNAMTPANPYVFISQLASIQNSHSLLS
jgi:hypothetical protein